VSEPCNAGAAAPNADELPSNARAAAAKQAGIFHFGFILFIVLWCYFFYPQ
jgi:hypothetical protein